MISCFLFVYLFTFVSCKAFHTNQHLPVQTFQSPLRYQPSQQYIPIFKPPLKAGEPNVPLTNAQLSDLERQYQQWQIAIPNGGQPGGVVWISAPQYYYPSSSKNPELPYPPSPASPIPAQGSGANQQNPVIQPQNNPPVTQGKQTTGTTFSNSTSITIEPTSTVNIQPSTTTEPILSTESSSELSNNSTTNLPLSTSTSESPITIGLSSSEIPTTLSPTSTSTDSSSESSILPTSSIIPDNNSSSQSTSTSVSVTESSSESNSTTSTTTESQLSTVTSNTTSVETTTNPQNTSSNATNPLLKYCKQPRGQFESDDCNKFINCWDDYAIEQECPNGLAFNSEKQYCDYPENVDCGNKTTNATSSSSNQTQSSNTTTNSKCPSAYGTYRNTSNCASFYVCVAGEPVDFNCPPGTNYNDDLKVCDYPYRVNCKGAPSIPIPEESVTTQVTETTPQSSTNSSTSISTSTESSINSSSPTSNSPSSSLSTSTSLPLSSASSPLTSTTPPTNTTSLSTIATNTSSPLTSTNTPTIFTETITTSTTSPAPVTPEIEISTIPPPAVDPIGYYNYNLKKLPESVVNTGVRCYHNNVFRLTPDCSSVTVCQEGLTYIVNCGSTTSFDAYTQTCVPSFRARC
ncbi:hypothetical protein PGB90_003723 [Kerria lacca]